MELQPGEFIAVLGRNGCGKSLTLHTLAGLRVPAAGHVELQGRKLRQLRRADVARALAFLPQDREDSLPLSVFEAALLGRHPHIGWLRGESAQDVQIVQCALARMDVAGCAERALGTLSGGEQRRAAMAGLLAQEPRVFLLDEPTNHLDPHHQVDVLLAFRERCKSGAGVIATLHDPALAERCADRVLLMYGDGRWRLGATAELLTAAELSLLYATPMNELSGGGRRAFIPA
jgi:iron complex transport system ATP-binding protein